MTVRVIRVRGSQPCPKCGLVHAVDARLAYEAANTNMAQHEAPPVRKRMTAAEAMAFSKARYAKTLEYLA